MDQNQNPVQTKGNRNVFCPYYRDCLDHAIKSCWDYWACFECQYKQKQMLSVDVLFSSVSTEPYYSLSPSLFEKVRNFSL